MEQMVTAPIDTTDAANDTLDVKASKNSVILKPPFRPLYHGGEDKHKEDK